MEIKIKEAGYENDIYLTSSIYDSVYYEVRKSPKIIKWMNETLIKVMVKPFMENSRIENTSECEIGNNWADLIEIKPDISEEDINKILKGL